MAGTDLGVYASKRTLTAMQHAFVRAYTRVEVLQRWLHQTHVAAVAHRQHTQRALSPRTHPEWLPPVPHNLSLFRLADGQLTWHVQDALRDDATHVCLVTFLSLVATPVDNAYAVDRNLAGYPTMTAPDWCLVDLLQHTPWYERMIGSHMSTLPGWSDIRISHVHAGSQPLTQEKLESRECMYCNTREMQKNAGSTARE
jgi:hypothetical protein